MTEIQNSDRAFSRFRLRVVVIGLVVVLCFGILLSRLYVLQVDRHDDLLAQAESNRTAVVPIVPNRGQIYDRNGVLLATNYSAYTLEITPYKMDDVEETIDALSALIEITPRDRRRFKRLREDSRNFDSLPIRSRLSDQEVAKFAAQRYRFPGVDVKARLFRSYPLGEAGAHLIGYIGRINQREKERIDDSDEAANYRGTEYIGKTGVEASYEKELHGHTGVERMETSAGGHAVRKLDSSPATPGESVVLSVDIKLQKMVEDLYGDRRGVAVAIDPRSGELLAMVSKPTYDPNIFVEGIDQESWKALNESIDRPLLNRAMRGTYPTGSTYKPFMGLAGLETGKRTPSTIIQDGGSWTFGGHTFRSGHALGPVDLNRAIQHSSNVYFYTLANEMGVDAIHDFMKPLGFGQITGIDLPGEVRGVLPSTAWKRDTYKRPEQKRWYAGETISLGIGQGYNNFTILQLTHALATILDNGNSRVPHVGRTLIDPVTGERRPIEQPPPVNLGYKQSHIDAVKRGMVSVVTGGTGRGSFGTARYTAGGKTGTAQAISIGQKEKYNAARLAERQRDHALYIAFAPAEDPKIAVGVIVENAGFGAGSAAPIARRIMDYWLLGEYPSEADMAAMQRGDGRAPIGTPRRVEDIQLKPETEQPQ
ncbi:penicillin-binding protein 2 [Comamonas piscis]|uniref:Peptidoglycan D,D-transpeptidase MrdA n=1 Tax=Comamonas piscis TaxID=1562974 RepID=A0A7G5EBX4_9BURK|nr:penicillin-binding protein 2 [Comamonas piscis]QMV71499.1 penicillin-binding protein 2 [Comamonas piscis]WSO34211.1 penicillin-binding protein 2 [Comamonas piscis]